MSVDEEIERGRNVHIESKTLMSVHKDGGRERERKRERGM
jgi:hypothetical protein